MNSYLSTNTKIKRYALEIMAIGTLNKSVVDWLLKLNSDTILIEAIESEESDQNTIYLLAILLKIAYKSECIQSEIKDENSAIWTAIYRLSDRFLVDKDENELSKDFFKELALFVEGIFFVTLFFEAKKHIGYYKSGKVIENLISISKHCKNHSNIVQGIVKTILHLSTSEEDEKTLFGDSKEVEDLKKFAEKGLANALSGEKDPAVFKAGPETEIDKIRDVLISKNVVGFLRKNALFKSNSTSKMSISFLAGNKGLKKEKLRFKRSIVVLLHGMARKPARRHALVQQGAISILLELHHNTEINREKILLADSLARILISTDPVILKPEIVPAVGRVLIDTELRKSKIDDMAINELSTFEALMALTNLASLSSETRSSLIEDNVWEAGKEGLYAENFRLQRAAVELFCNLLQCNEALEKLEKDPQLIKIFYLFCKSDDDATVIAALSIMAMISYPETDFLGKIDFERGFFEGLKFHGNSRVREVSGIVLNNVNSESA